VSAHGRRVTLAWIGCLALVALALVVGASRSASPSSPRQRAAAVDAVVRCPSCEGLSVADSSSATAVAIRNAVLARARAGQSDGRIEQFLVSRYGPGILLRPPAGGLAGLVWFLPVLAGAGGLAALGVVFWRRRAPAPVVVSDEDRRLVDAAMAQGARPSAAGEARLGAAP